MQQRQHSEGGASRYHNHRSDHPTTSHNAYRTAEFLRSLQHLGGSSSKSQRALLEAGLAHMVTPRITLTEYEVLDLFYNLEREVQWLSPCAMQCDQTRQDRFLRALQKAVPLVDEAEFDAVWCRGFASVEAAIETAVARVKGMPDARRLECVTQGRCVWAVDWSAEAVDALLEALRITTLGTVRDVFEHFAKTNCVIPLKDLLAENRGVRLIVSAAGESEFDVTKNEATSGTVDSKSQSNRTSKRKARFIQPARGGIVAPAFTQDELVNHPSFVLQLVAGVEGAGKTLAAIQFAMEPYPRNQYNLYGQHDDMNSVTCVLYCKAKDFMTTALDASDDTSPNQEENSCRGGTRDGRFDAEVMRLRSSTRRLAEYVITTLMGGGNPPPPNQTKVVRSYDCRVAIVVDDIGSFPSLVTCLIDHYYKLIKVLREILHVDSVRVIAAGHGVEFYYPNHSDDYGRKFLLRRITTDVWEESLAVELEKEIPFVRILRARGDPYDLGWLRSALTNARFACVFSNRLLASARGRFLVGATSTTSFPGMGNDVAAGGFRLLALAAMETFSIQSAVLPNCDVATLALRRAIGVMIDRQPFCSAVAHEALLKETHCIVTIAATKSFLRDRRRADVAMTRVRARGASFWVDGCGAAERDSHDKFVFHMTLPRGRPLYMVDRVYCSMFMLMVVGNGACSLQSVLSSLTRAVMHFASLAASLPSDGSAALDARPGVPPLRRLLNQLGNDASVSAGACAWQAVAPRDISKDTNWALVDPAGAAAAVSAAMDEDDDREAAALRADAAFWAQLRTCVRADGRAAVIANRLLFSEEGTSVFVVAPRVVTLLHTVMVCCQQKPLGAKQVKEALLRMAPVGGGDGADYVLEAGSEASTGEEAARTTGTRQQGKQQQSEQLWQQELQQQQRVPEELVALARGVTFKRCQRTQRAVVRRPPAGDTAPPAFVVNVAVVFEGAHSVGLRRDVLCGAFGAQWSDLAASGGGGGCSGPFAVRESSSTSSSGVAPIDDGGRCRAEVVLDYFLEQSAADDEEGLAQSAGGGGRPNRAKRRRREGPMIVPDSDDDDGNGAVLRVAFRYFIVDVTWCQSQRRGVAAVSERKSYSHVPRCSGSCSLSPTKPLPPLYPVPQTETTCQFGDNFRCIRCSGERDSVNTMYFD